MAPILEISQPWDLSQTGWMVIFAPDINPRVRSALEQLLEFRRRTANRIHSHYYREITYAGETTYDFIERHGGRPGRLADPDYLPYYTLLVGNPDSLPYSFQAELGVNHAVGRICFTAPQDYANYAYSVVQAESSSQPIPRKVVFFAPEHENDPASQATARDLVRPLAESIFTEGMRWEIEEARGAEARKERLRNLLGGTETPALLFAACHGIGFDEGDERQETSQGALVCQDWRGPDDEEGVGEDQWFAASDIPDTASLRGLVAFFYASYSVGTLKRALFDQQTFGRARPIAPRPLVARLPQQLLGRRDGALAVIGHVDRVWAPTFSASVGNEKVAAFLYGVRRLLQGHTVGWAMEYLNQSYVSLAAMFGSLEESVQSGGQEEKKKLIGALYLMGQDARTSVIV